MSEEKEKKVIPPQVVTDIVLKAIISDEALAYLRAKFCDNEIIYFNPVYPDEFGFVHNYHYLYLKEAEFNSFLSQVREQNRDFSFALYNETITSINYYYRNNFSYIRIKSSLEYFLANKEEFINNLEKFMQEYPISRVAVEHGRAFDIHKYRDDIIHLNEPDFDFSQYVFEGLHQGKYYKIIGNDIKYHDILTTFSLGIDKEYLAGHDHYDYETGLIFGSSWLMYHSADYDNYLSLERIKSFAHGYRNATLPNGIVKTQLYEDISAFADDASIQAMWAFKNDLDLEPLAHKLLGIVYPTISKDELKTMKDEATKLIAIEPDEYHTAMYYYILFQSNNSFDYSLRYYQQFIRDVMIMRCNNTNFQLMNNRNYFTKSLGTEFVEIAYYNYKKKILDFSYNSIALLDEVIIEMQAYEKKNKTEENARRVLVEKMACYFVLTLLINNESIVLAREGNTKPLGYLEVGGYTYDIENKLYDIIYNTKHGFFSHQSNQSLVEYFNEISSMAKLNINALN